MTYGQEDEEGRRLADAQELISIGWSVVLKHSKITDDISADELTEREWALGRAFFRAGFAWAWLQSTERGVAGI